MTSKLIALIAFVVIAGFVATSSLFVVDEREQVLVVQFGEPKRTIQEPGLYFKNPLTQQLIRVDKRILSLDVRPQEVLANDSRRILVDSFARFRVSDPLKMYQAARTEARAANLLLQIMQSTTRQVLAKQAMETIVSGDRASLMREITDITNDQAANIGLDVLDVRLKRVDLPRENSESIFERMRTEREREAKAARAQGQEAAIAIKADADRQVAIIAANAERDAQKMRGEADARVVRIFSEAYGQDEEFFEFYRTMQAYRVSLGKEDTTLVLSPDSEFFKLFITQSDGN